MNICAYFRHFQAEWCLDFDTPGSVPADLVVDSEGGDLQGHGDDVDCGVQDAGLKLLLQVHKLFFRPETIMSSTSSNIKNNHAIYILKHLKQSGYPHPQTWKTIMSSVSSNI